MRHRKQATVPITLTPFSLAALAALVALVTATACEQSDDAAAPSSAPETRVISLSPALTRIVVALGAERTLVGVDRFSRQLPGLHGLPELGGLFATDLERTVQLAPTLILAVGNREQQSYLSALQTRGVAVESFDGHTLEEVLASVERIGRLLGNESQGCSLAQSIRSELDQIAASSEQRTAPRPRIAIVVAVDPLYVVAGGSFVNELIEIAGAENVFGELPEPYARVGLEALAERAPEVLVDTTRAADEAGAARGYWQRYRWIRRLAFLPQGILTLPGPDLAQATTQLREAIHP